MPTVIVHMKTNISYGLLTLIVCFLGHSIQARDCDGQSIEHQSSVASDVSCPSEDFFCLSVNF
jgi:hypothetical protein